MKLFGLHKLKTAVFISGTGSNLENLIKFSLQKKSPILIKLIVSNNKNAKGLIFSKRYKIEKKIFKFLNKRNDEKIIIRYLEKKI